MDEVSSDESAFIGDQESLSESSKVQVHVDRVSSDESACIGSGFFKEEMLLKE